MSEASDPTAGWFEGREHRLPVRVYYEDTDFTGVVYHANYLKYFERGRSDFLRMTGCGHSVLLAREDPLAFVVSTMELVFLKPARIDDALTVGTAYDAISGARIAIRQRLMRGADILTTAAVQVACIGLDKRPRRPPPSLVQGLQPFLLPKSADPPP